MFGKCNQRQYMPLTFGLSPFSADILLVDSAGFLYEALLTLLKKSYVVGKQTIPNNLMTQQPKVVFQCFLVLQHLSCIALAF